MVKWSIRRLRLQKNIFLEKQVGTSVIPIFGVISTGEYVYFD